MSEWQLLKFKDLFSIPLRNGLTKPSRVRGSGLRMVNMKEIFGYNFIDDKTPMELVPISENERSSMLAFNDLLFARQSLVESGAGKIAIFKGNEPTVFESHLIRCRLDLEKGFADFIYYLFKSSTGRGAVSTIVQQVAAAGIRGSDLQELTFNIPPLPEQKAIAAVLSSLDDKIDLLHRQNKTLEAMAETLFRQWFIEEAKDDWEDGCLGDIVTNVKDTVSASNINEDWIYIGLEHISRRNIALTQYGYGRDVSSNKFFFKQNDILFGKLRPYFHKVCFSAIEGICSTDILVLRPKKSDFFAFSLFAFYQDDVVEFANLGSGGTRMPRTDWNMLKSFPIALPDKNIIKRFNNLVIPSLEKITKNIIQIQTLEKLRDNLLPKLMSGEVRVSYEQQDAA